MPPQSGKELKTRLDTALYRVRVSSLRARSSSHSSRSLPYLHFTPRYPKYHDSPFRIECWCSLAPFSTECLDTTELARMIAWFNEHASCPSAAQEQAE